MRIRLIMLLILVGFINMNAQSENKGVRLPLSQLTRHGDAVIGELSFQLSNNDAPAYLVIRWPAEAFSLKYKWEKESQWLELRPDDHAPDGEINHVNMIMVPQSNQKLLLEFPQIMETNLLEAELFELKVEEDLFESGAQLTEQCPCESIEYVTRTGWSCPWGDESANFSPESSPFSHLAVHHQGGAATSPYQNTVLAIWNYHVNTNRWSDIGYHWLIDPNGVIYKGRAWQKENEQVLGAHLCSCNRNKMGVCLLGDLSFSQPTEAQVNSLVKLLVYKSCQFGIHPGVLQPGTSRSSGTCQDALVRTIIGHREGCPPAYTECPGNAFYPHLSEVITRVENQWNECMNINTDIVNESNEIRVYPNPAEGLVQVDLDGKEAAWLTLYDVLGQVCTQYKPSGTSFQMDMPEVRGSYFLKIKLNDGKILQKRLTRI